MAFGETLAGLFAEVPKAMCEPATLASVLRKSNELAELEAVAQSWFEDEPQVAQAVERGRGRARPYGCARLPGADLCWRELAIVAKALVDGVFAIGGWQNDEPSFTFKVSDTAFEMLKEQPGLRPAPYLASRGMKWIQHFAKPGLSDGALREYTASLVFKAGATRQTAAGAA